MDGVLPPSRPDRQPSDTGSGPGGPADDAPANISLAEFTENESLLRVEAELEVVRLRFELSKLQSETEKLRQVSLEHSIVCVRQREDAYRAVAARDAEMSLMIGRLEEERKRRVEAELSAQALSSEVVLLREKLGLLCALMQRAGPLVADAVSPSTAPAT